MHNSLKPILLGTATSVVFIILCAVLSKNMGYVGLPLATSLSAVVLMLLLLAGLRQHLGHIDGKRLLRLILISGAAAVATAAAVAFAVHLFPSGENASHFVAFSRLLLLGLGATWVYLGIGRLLGLEEAKYAFAAISRRRNPEASSEESQ